MQMDSHGLGRSNEGFRKPHGCWFSCVHDAGPKAWSPYWMLLEAGGLLSLQHQVSYGLDCSSNGLQHPMGNVVFCALVCTMLAQALGRRIRWLSVRGLAYIATPGVA